MTMMTTLNMSELLNKKRLPLSSFVDLRDATAPLREELIEACTRVIDSGWFLHGPETRAFEAELAASCGAKHAVAVSNGLDALRLTLRAWIRLGAMKPGDEVIVAANTYVASVLAITDAGLSPRLVEPDPASFNLDPARVEEAITSRTRAIMEVHLYGLPCDHSSISDIAQRHGLLIIEDNAQAIGATAHGRATGALGDAAAFSFYPTKNIGALGDAGAVTTSDSALASAVRALANYGSDRRYHNIYEGFNCRMDEMQAAMLRVKLRHMEEECLIRENTAHVYSSTICHKAVITPTVSPGMRHVWHQYVVRVKDRDSFRRYLQEQGVPTDVHYAVPPHMQPCYHDRFSSPLPLTEQLAAEVVSLPIAEMPTGTAREIALIINNF